MRRRRKQEQGFALLLVFAFAAGIAIFLYMELPRAVFESARVKEDILVERAQQYVTAIRRYRVKTGNLPTSIEQLENTNGVRFLRRKYVDPMTGKDEWRLIHSDVSGAPADSKVTKPKNTANAQEKSVNTLVAEGYQVGGGLPAGAAPAGMQDIAMRQRATDRLPTPAASADAPASTEPPAPGQDEQPPLSADAQRGPPDTQGQGQPANPSFPGLPTSGPLAPGGPPNLPPGQQVPGGAQQAGNTAVATGGFGIGGGIGAVGGIGAAATGTQQPAAQATTGQTPGQQSASNIIQNLLTTPRQGTALSSGSATTTQGPSMAGAIIGVASKYEGVGIKLVNERSRIDEWEFLFDIKTVGAAQGGGAGMPGMAPGGGAGNGGRNQQGGQQPGGNGQGGGMFRGGGGQGGYGPPGPNGQPGFNQGNGQQQLPFPNNRQR